jgi:tRNA modification GTPase
VAQFNSTDDTIAAICTPPGEGGVGIVRLSGPQAIPIAEALFRSARGVRLGESKQRMYYGHFLDAEARTLDEVLVHCMRAPHSFTRQDVVEINAHGGAGPLNAILDAVLQQGARLAGPGEFTFRAFVNGRIDLVQAEAVIDLIRARTHAGLQAANAAARGVLSTTLVSLSERLRRALAQIEAAVDFPEEEDVPQWISPALLADLNAALEEMRALLRTADAGRILREGATIAIAGRPNVGKSSLFNALLRDARAIVSAQAGTTRDRLEDFAAFGGVPVKLVDTAGLRDADDEVERMGVARAREAVQQANAVLFVLDATAGYTVEDAALADELAGLSVPVVVLWNKLDLAAAPALPPLPFAPAAECALSAMTGDGLAALEAQLESLLLGGLHLAADQAMLNRTHQKESLRRAAGCLARLLEQPGASPEFLALDLQEALDALGEITGETTPDDILGMIFGAFCIGK